MTHSSTSHWNQAKLSLQCLLSCLEDVKHWMDGNFLQLNESKTQISGTLICIKYWQINSLADFSTTAKIKQFLSFWELRQFYIPTYFSSLYVGVSQSILSMLTGATAHLLVSLHWLPVQHRTCRSIFYVLFSTFGSISAVRLWKSHLHHQSLIIN